MSRSGGICNGVRLNASMKVPPKRKGNGFSTGVKLLAPLRLNESPSEKEGKSSPGALSNRPHLLGLNESPSEKEGKSACSFNFHAT